MKAELTKEQSAHLIELGVSREKANKIEYIQLTDSDGRPIDEHYKNTFKWHYLEEKPFTPFIIPGGGTTYSSYDIFTLTDLLKILPKEIEYHAEGWSYMCPLNIIYGNYDIHGNSLVNSKGYDAWFAEYSGYAKTGDEHNFCKKELIDALYELLCWCIKNGHLKFDKI